MSEEHKETPPRAFLSYSWTTPEYEIRVLEIAQRLVSDGVDVVLDKWDLKEGHDAHAFMERMVTDTTVTKVIIMSDGEYARKADAREKGVGTETQIISADVYGRVAQTKFIPVLMERRAEGPCLPTFLGSRKYIDFSTEQAYLENYDQLLRALYDKPLYVKPQLGKRPTHLDRPEGLGGYTHVLVAELASQLTRGNLVGACVVFENLLSKLLDALDGLIVQEVPAGKHVDEVVRERLPSFLPYRDDYIDALLEFAGVHKDPAAYEPLHGFLEAVFRKQPRHPRNETSKDGLVVASLELLLYTVAALLKKGRYEVLQHLLDCPYLVNYHERHESVTPFEFPFYSCGLQDDWQNRENKPQRRISVVADLLRERASHKKIGFTEVCQAELVLFVRATTSGQHWYPRSLIFQSENGAMEVFARARSRRVLGQLLPVLGVASKDELVSKVKEASGHARMGEGFWDFPRSLESWMDIERLGSLP